VPSSSAASRIQYVRDLESNSLGLRLSSFLNPLSLVNFVLMGDVANFPNNTSYGSVGSVNYNYYIGKYVVTNCEYVEFLNSKAKSDPYGLYNNQMGLDPRSGIMRFGTSGNYSYVVKTNMGNKPVVWISWFDCCRYCNWLHNDKENGDTETGSYTLNGIVTGSAPARNINAKYHIPTENEWYKAAYYKGGSTNAGYWAYATQSDLVPATVTANDVGDGSARISEYSCTP
jgi:formylglycine-generating enzyme required for sulfatase activity